MYGICTHVYIHIYTYCIFRDVTVSVDLNSQAHNSSSLPNTRVYSTLYIHIKWFPAAYVYSSARCVWTSSVSGQRSHSLPITWRNFYTMHIRVDEERELLFLRIKIRYQVCMLRPTTSVTVGCVLLRVVRWNIYYI